MISYQNKFIYIDIVKTAGTSLGEVFKQFGGEGKHHSISRPLPNVPLFNAKLQPLLGSDEINNFFKFTIVRNPFDRFISLYAFTQESALGQYYEQNGWNGILTTVANRLPKRGLTRETYYPKDVGTYIKQLINHEEYYCDYTLEKYIPMIDWLKDFNDNIKIDFIGKYENLEEDTKSILRKLGFDDNIYIPKKNISNNLYKEKAQAEIKKSKKLQHLLIDYYIEDFDFFGYPKKFGLAT